jgi:hypothetical protein
MTASLSSLLIVMLKSGGLGSETASITLALLSGGCILAIAVVSIIKGHR